MKCSEGRTNRVMTKYVAAARTTSMLSTKKTIPDHPVSRGGNKEEDGGAMMRNPRAAKANASVMIPMKMRCSF